MEQQTLRDLLTERGIRMDAAAALAGVSASTISRICSGAERARPKTVTSLSKALGVSVRRMQSLCNASYETARTPLDGQWSVWIWNERMRLWVQVDEGSEEDMEKWLANQQLAGQQSAVMRFAMSKKGEPLPEPPASRPTHETA